MIPTAVICTRGDVPLGPVLDSLPKEWPVVVWNGQERGNEERIYGYFAALDEVETEFVYTNADDAVCPAQELLDNWTEEDSGRILLNERDGETPWISFGAIFNKSLPKPAFDRYLSAYPRDDDFLLWCELIFTTLTPWRNVGLGKIDLPWNTNPNRMEWQPNHYVDQARVRDRCWSLSVAEMLA